MKLSKTLRRKLENNLIQVFLPEDVTSTFDSVFGLDNAKAILQDVVTYFQNDCKTIEPYTSYAIIGPHGSKKESLVFATANASKLPVISVDTSIFTTEDEDDINKKLNLIFKVSEKLQKEFPGVLIMFQNLHQTEEMDNDNLFYLNLVREYRKTKKTFLFALSSRDNWVVPPLVMQEGLFETNIIIDYPDLATREKIFEACIKKENLTLAPDVSINRLAKDTYGETYRSIEHIVKDTHLYSVRQNHTEVTQNDFSETIMRLSAGDKNIKMTEKERKLCAYHEAGHVIAGYFSNNEYVLSRVEISPRSQGSLGLTLSDVDENKYSYFKEDFENRIISSFGGLAAEEEVFGAHTSGVISDLSMATMTAANMVKAYGMDNEFGPIVVLPGITDSLLNTSMADMFIKEILNNLLEKTKKIIKEKRPYLDALAKALVEKEVVLGTEIKDIFDKVDAEVHEIETVSFEEGDLL